MTNYSGTLAGAFSAMASLGASGCGFEQPLQAAKNALNNNPANAGFLRPNASLALFFVTDEDDCSISHSTILGSDTTTFGPLQRVLDTVELSVEQWDQELDTNLKSVFLCAKAAWPHLEAFLARNAEKPSPQRVWIEAPARVLTDDVLASGSMFAQRATG